MSLRIALGCSGFSRNSKTATTTRATAVETDKIAIAAVPINRAAGRSYQRVRFGGGRGFNTMKIMIRSFHAATTPYAHCNTSGPKPTAQGGISRAHVGHCPERSVGAPDCG